MEHLIIKEEFKHFLKNIDNPIAQKLISGVKTNNINYIDRSIDKPSFMSYLTMDRIKRFDKSEYWIKEKRYHAKPSKVIEMIFPGEFQDKEKMKFAESLKLNTFKQSNNIGRLKIVEGEDIKDYYLESNYSEDDDEEETSLWQSCMRYSDCQDYLEIYSKNTRQISLAVLLDDEDLVQARCLLWYPDGKNSDVKWFDRIYSLGHDLDLEMRAELENLGYINISPKNEGYCKDGYISIKLDYSFGEFDEYPYIDTFQHWDGYSFNNSDGKIEFNCTDGTYSEPQRCACCDDETDEDDLVTIDEGRYEYEQVCTTCAVRSEYHGGWVLRRDATRDDWNDDWVLNDYLVTDYTGEKIIEDDSIELYDGRYAHKNDDEIYTDIGGGYFHRRDDNFVEIDGYYYHVNHPAIEQIEGEYQLIS